MKVSSISKSSNLSCKARFKCNGEALEQLGKKKVSELEKTCKKIGTNRDFILVGSKSISTKNLPGVNTGVEKAYVNTVAYQVKGEIGLAFLKNTTDIISNKASQGLSHLSKNLNEFIKRF